MSDLDTCNKVFVYGTLKRGYLNNERCLHDCQFLYQATTKNNYLMCNIGFPTVFPRPEDDEEYPTIGRVQGEVFQINEEARQRCDRLEGHPRMYKRQLVDIATEAGEELRVWMYLWQGDFDQLELVKPNKQGLLVWDSKRSRF